MWSVVEGAFWAAHETYTQLSQLELQDSDDEDGQAASSLLQRPLLGRSAPSGSSRRVVRTPETASGGAGTAARPTATRSAAAAAQPARRRWAERPVAAQRESGCLPCTNSFVVVKQDQFVAVEHFGRYYQLLSPGFSCTGFDVCGCCIRLRTMSRRIEQLRLVAQTLTLDHVSVDVSVAVQFAPNPERISEAMYSLSDPHSQIKAYVADAMRALISQRSVDDVFASRDEMSRAAEQRLKLEMANFGFDIHHVLVTEILPDVQVIQAMTDLVVSTQALRAAIVATEGSRIVQIAQAEGAAHAAHLRGEATARRVGAILQGLRAATAEASAGVLTPALAVELLLMTEYFETLRQAAQESEGQVVFISTKLAESARSDLGAKAVTAKPTQHSMETGDAGKRRWAPCGSPQK